jgi:hypothetical protein
LKNVEKGFNQGRRPELVGGGLIRSLGGWSEVLAGRRRGEKNASDQRILGDGEFVNQIISDLDDLVKKNLRLSGRRIDIKTAARKVAEKFDISISELRSGGRRKAVVKAWQTLSWLAVRELGYSGAEVARYLGVTTSCITRFVSEGKKDDIEDIDLEDRESS